MNIQLTDNVGNVGTDNEADIHANEKLVATRNPRAAIKPKSAATGKKAAPTSKKGQFVALLSKSNGADLGDRRALGLAGAYGARVTVGPARAEG